MAEKERAEMGESKREIEKLNTQGTGHDVVRDSESVTVLRESRADRRVASALSTAESSARDRNS
eukprot:3732931-Rhodomonas_salina.1